MTLSLVAVVTDVVTDVVRDGRRIENSHIRMPDLPGIGFEGKSDLYKVMRELATIDNPYTRGIARIERMRRG